MTTMLQPRTLRPAPDPLGSFIRPGYNDHVVLAQTLAERRGTGSGFIVNPVHQDRQLPLLAEAQAAGVETVLDSKSLELSTPGGRALPGIADLPWAGPGMHSPLLLSGAKGARVVQSLAEYAAQIRASAVLAPTHFISDVASTWWSTDATLVRSLRRMLDEREMTKTLVYYPVMLRATTLLNPAMAAKLVEHLRGLPIDGLWLRLHPFGTTASGPLALKRYLQLCRQLHVLGVPVVAEHSGNVGLALMAFGAVGGIESGVTFADTVNLSGLLRPPKPDGKGFGRAPRVYLHQLGAFVEQAIAREFFAKRGTKALHGCKTPAAVREDG